MVVKKVFLKLVMLTLSLAALQAVATPAQPPLCREFAVLCSTNTGAGTCGFEGGQVCTTCYGMNGSILADAPDCVNF
jgi:hypothetical protein